MKSIITKPYLIVLPILLIFETVLFLQFYNTKNINKNIGNKVCYSVITETGRCTGSAYCRACSNCSRCKYCNNGGACGVCSKKSSRRREKVKSNYPIVRKQQQKQNIFDGRNRKVLTVENSYTTNLGYNTTVTIKNNKTILRSKAGSKYFIIQTLSKYEKVKVLLVNGMWLKVKVKHTKKTGYIHITEIYREL